MVVWTSGNRQHFNQCGIKCAGIQHAETLMDGGVSTGKLHKVLFFLIEVPVQSCTAAWVLVEIYPAASAVGVAGKLSLQPSS